MNAKELSKMLREFERGIESVSIVNEFELEHGATLIISEINGKFGTMRLPIIHYEGKDWLMTPCDWQDDRLADITPDTIDTVDWRVDGSEIEAIIFEGLPMLPMWVADPSEAKQQARRNIGKMIAAARKKQGFTTRQLADMCGLPQSHIVRIESGRYAVTIDTIGIIAATLGLRISLE